MSNTRSFLSDAEALSAWLSETRRAFHRQPERSREEVKTSARCAELLEGFGLQVRRGVAGHGVIADLNIPGASRRIALRADMDALPLQERSDTPYKSEIPGVAHMCGHDAHMTIALGAARMLAKHRDTLPCSVRWLFQPSEELPPGGALGMIEAGALDGVDEVYGLHNVPELEVGDVQTRDGVLTAAADLFEITLYGRGGHAARPHKALDPIPGACALVTQLQTLISRHCAPSQAAVLSVTRFHAGTTHNIIPDQVELEGTVRTFDANVRDLIQTRMAEMIQGVANAHGLRAEFNYVRGYDSIVNHTSGVTRVTEATQHTLGADAFQHLDQPKSWGEDFAYFLQHRPGAFFLLGSGNRERGITEPLHSPFFDIDEQCLVVGSALMASLAWGGGTSP